MGSGFRLQGVLGLGVEGLGLWVKDVEFEALGSRGYLEGGHHLTLMQEFLGAACACRTPAITTGA